MTAAARRQLTRLRRLAEQNALVERLVRAGYAISLHGPMAVRVLEGRTSERNPRFLAEILGADHPAIWYAAKDFRPCSPLEALATVAAPADARPMGGPAEAQS